MLNHVITILAAALVMKLYSDKRKILVLVSIVVLIDIFNYWLALNGNGIYNDIGSFVNYVIFGVLIFSRYRTEKPLEQINYEKFIFLLLGNQIASYSHAVDFLIVILGLESYEGLENNARSMWRPHMFWHTPLFALLTALITSIIIFYLLEYWATRKNDSKFKIRTPLYQLTLTIWIGYLVHIIGDTIVYDFPIYFFWPFNDYSASLYSFANNGFIVSCPPSNPDCYVYYYAMPIYAITFLFLASLMILASSSNYRNYNNFLKKIDE